ncbi:MAG: hypothetical protein ABI743_05740 [bacterium]
MATIEELTKELQQAKMLLEVEKQRARQLETEVERLKKGATGRLASGPSLGSLAPPVGAPTLGGSRLAGSAPGLASAATPNGDAGETGESDLANVGGTDAEFDENRRQLDDVTREKHEVEQRKWTIDKENIALKETLNKLKVQGQNSQKNIEELVEKLDRKENQNFKTRLEITDLRKALNGGRTEREKQEETIARLRHEAAEIESEIRHYKAIVEVETQRRDVITAELNRQQDILGQYQSGFLARFYDK